MCRKTSFLVHCRLALISFSLHICIQPWNTRFRKDLLQFWNKHGTWKGSGTSRTMISIVKLCIFMPVMKKTALDSLLFYRKARILRTIILQAPRCLNMSAQEVQSPNCYPFLFFQFTRLILYISHVVQTSDSWSWLADELTKYQFMGTIHIEKKTTHRYIIGVWKIYWTHCILEFAQIPSKLFEPSCMKEYLAWCVNNGWMLHWYWV